MGKRDPRCDAYIAKSADFAKPMLDHLRKIVHKGCAEVVEEMKWSMPHFSYKGMFCGMAVTWMAEGKGRNWNYEA